MLKITTLISILFSINAFGSTNGGGILFKNAMMKASIDQLALESTHGGGVLLGSKSTMPSLESLGGSGGGGGVLNPRMAALVYFQAENNGWTQFSVATQKQGGWDVVSLRIENLQGVDQSNLLEAVDRSKLTRSWAPITVNNE